jgi:hypothetical protein
MATPTTALLPQEHRNRGQFGGGQSGAPAQWRRVALIVAKRTGHAIGLDTATRMLAREHEARVQPCNSASNFSTSRRPSFRK